MGMYDYVVCRYPLPTEFVESADHQYQSKSLDCRMALYEITEDGCIRQSGGGAFESEFDSQPFAFNGTVEFYDGNTCVSAYGQGFTPSGEDREWVSYEAVFLNGVLQQIRETEREREPALSREVYHQLDGMFQEDEPVVDLSEPEVGAEMYVLWGSIDRKLDGYPVKLIAKTSRDWAFQDRNDRIETIPPSQLGNCLFHSESDAKARRSWQHRLWDRKTEYCKELLQAKVRPCLT